MNKNILYILGLIILTILILTISLVMVFYADYSYFWFSLNVIEIIASFIVMIKDKTKLSKNKDKAFVDRKAEFKTIRKYIRAARNFKKLRIDISGKPGIGVKSLIYKTDFYFKNKFFYECCKISKLEKDIFLYWKEFTNIDNYTDNEINVIIKNKIERNKTYIFFVENYIPSNEQYITKSFNIWNGKEKSRLVIVTGTHIYNNDIPDKNSIDNSCYVRLNVLEDEYIEQICRNNKLNNENYIKEIKELSKGIPAYADYLSRKSLPDETVDDLEESVNRILNSESNLEVVLNILANQFLNLHNDYKIGSYDLEKLLNIDEAGNTVISSWVFQLMNDSIKVKLAAKILETINSQKLQNELFLLCKYLLEDNAQNFTKNLNAVFKNQDYNLIYEFVDKIELFNLKLDVLKEWLKNKEVFYLFYETYLKLGYYYKANEFLKSIEKTLDHPFIYAHKEMSLIDVKLFIANIDYYHSINDFETSNHLIEILQSEYYDKISNKNYNIQFKYAHNLRHAGELDEADKLFQDIVNNVPMNTVEYVRSCYSILSDVTFKGKSQVCINGKIDNVFDLLNELRQIKVKGQSDLEYSIARHIGIYYKRLEQDYEKSYELFETIIASWKKNSKVRIIYDFYFEVAEAYRLEFIIKKRQKFYINALNYYELAILFADQNNDYNLMANALMGKLLLEKSRLSRKHQLTKELNDIQYYVDKSNSQINKFNYKIIARFCTNNKSYSDLIDYSHANEWLYHENILKLNKIDMLQLTVM